MARRAHAEHLIWRNEPKQLPANGKNQNPKLKHKNFSQALEEVIGKKTGDVDCNAFIPKY